MTHTIITLFKWLSTSPVSDFFKLVSSIRGAMWAVKQLCRLFIWLINVISDNKDKLITIFTKVKDLVSSLIYRISSLIRCYKSFFIGKNMIYGF